MDVAPRAEAPVEQSAVGRQSNGSTNTQTAAVSFDRPKRIVGIAVASGNIPSQIEELRIEMTNFTGAPKIKYNFFEIKED